MLTDDSYILGLADLGVQGMAIPLDIYICVAGINPHIVCVYATSLYFISSYLWMCYDTC